MTPKPASWVTYPAVITMEKENSREKDNTQNQRVGCQNHTLLCFKIPMESALCNSVCTLSLQSILKQGYSSDFAWEYKRLANSHIRDVHHKLPNAHKHAVSLAAGQDVIVLMDSCWEEVPPPPKATKKQSPS